MKRMLVITGVLAWCGGMATMLLGGSCDVECLPDERPSVVLSLRPTNGSFDEVLAAGTEVTFTVESIDAPSDPFESLRDPVTDQIGRCLDHDCTTWALGVDRPGRYRIEAMLCGHPYETEVEVGLDDDGCHVRTEYATIMFDASRCAEPTKQVGDPPPPEIGGICDALPRPSAHVWVAVPEESYFRGVDVERVWFRHDGEVGEATCIHETELGCSAWAAGRDLVGPMTIFTEYCDREFSVEVDVEKTSDRCHADTEFVTLPVDTLGCMRDPSREPPGPDPVDPVER